MHCMGERMWLFRSPSNTPSETRAQLHTSRQRSSSHNQSPVNSLNFSHHRYGSSTRSLSPSLLFFLLLPFLLSPSSSPLSHSDHDLSTAPSSPFHSMFPQFYECSGFAWDRLPPVHPPLSGHTTVAMPLVWMMADGLNRSTDDDEWRARHAHGESSSGVDSALPLSGPLPSSAYLLLSFGGESSDGASSDLVMLTYPPHIEWNSRQLYAGGGGAKADSDSKSRTDPKRASRSSGDERSLATLTIRPQVTGVTPIARVQHCACLLTNPRQTQNVTDGYTEQRQKSNIRLTDQPHPHSSPNFSPLTSPGWMVLFGGMNMQREMNSLWLYEPRQSTYIGLGPVPNEEDVLNSPELPESTSIIDLGVKLGSTYVDGSGMKPDGFGCPWPSPRSLSSIVTMKVKSEDGMQERTTLFIFGGIFNGVAAGQTYVWADLWSLDVDSDEFFNTLITQSQSADGQWVGDQAHLAGRSRDSATASACMPWRHLTLQNASSIDRSAAPSPRFKHGLVAVEDEQALYVFGGAKLLLYDQFLDDLWRYDVRRDVWQEVKSAFVPPSSSGSGLRPSLSRYPEPRASHSLVLIDDVMWMIGGSNNMLLHPPAYTFAFNLTELRAQNNLNTQDRNAHVDDGMNDAELTCTNCWVSLPNSATYHDMPGEDKIPIRLTTYTAPMHVEMEDGHKEWHVVRYGGAPISNQAIDELTTFAILTNTANDIEPSLQQNITIAPIPTLPIPYYANQVAVCGNDSGARIDADGTYSRPNAPHARSYHTVCAYGDTLYIGFGEVGRADTMHTLDDVWSYSLTQDRWTLVGRSDGMGRREGKPDQPWPRDRIAPASAIVGDEWIMFGGGLMTEQFLADVWLYNFDSDVWREVNTSIDPSSPVQKMDGRYGHSAVVIGDRLYSFGGSIDNMAAFASTNELWMLDLTTWVWYLQNASPPSDRPGARFGHVSIVIPQYITAKWMGKTKMEKDPTQFIVGLGGSYQDLYDNWYLFDVTTGRWVPYYSERGSPPTVRFFPSYTLLRDRLILFAGFDGNNRNDMYELDLSTQRWRELTIPRLVSGSMPRPRAGAPGIALNGRAMMAIFSGDSEPWQNDLHIFTADTVMMMYQSHHHDVPPRHDVLALLAPYMPLPHKKYEQFTPSVTFATLSAAILYYQSIDAGYVRYLVVGNGTSATTADTHLTRRLHTVTLRSASLVEGVTDDLDHGSLNLMRPEDYPLIDCADSSCFRVWTGDNDDPVEFDSLHLCDASAFSGSAIAVKNSALWLRNMIFSRNVATARGGAIEANSSVMEIDDSHFIGSRAGRLGAAIYAALSHIQVHRTNFTNNSVLPLLTKDGTPMDEKQRIIIDEDGYPTIGASTDSERVPTASPNGDAFLPSQYFGGAVTLLSTIAQFLDGYFVNNTAHSGAGGAIAAIAITAAVPNVRSLFDQLATLQLGWNVFMNNHADRGGAVFQSRFVQGREFTPVNSTTPDIYLSHYIENAFVGNEALLGGGGAIFLEKSTQVRMQGGKMESNVAKGTRAAGGAIMWTIDEELITDRPALKQASPIIEGVRMLNNSAPYGNDIASPAVQLVLEDDRSRLHPQVSGEHLDPPPVLSLRDWYGQLVSIDDDTFISAQPSNVLSGDLVCRVSRGVANFSALSLSLRPLLSTHISFSSSLFLPLWAEDSAAHRISLNLTSAPCSAGQYLPNSKAQKCADCPSGKYSVMVEEGESEMHATCKDCRPGRFQNSTRATSCYACVIGTYSPSAGLAAESGCPLCPFGSYSYNEGASSCTSCDSGLVCENKQVLAGEGRWLVYEYATPSENSSQPAAVHVETIGAYSVLCPGSNCASGGVCGTNRLNPPSDNILCGQCISDEYSELNGNCAYCPSTNIPLVFTLVLLGFCFVLLLHHTAQGRRNNAEVHILAYFAQTVFYQCGGNTAVWLEWLSFFNVSPKGLMKGSEQGVCLWPMSAYGELMLDVLTPVQLFGQLVLIVVVHRGISRVLERSGGCFGLRRVMQWRDDQSASHAAGGMSEDDIDADLANMELDDVVFLDQKNSTAAVRPASGVMPHLRERLQQVDEVDEENGSDAEPKNAGKAASSPPAVYERGSLSSPSTIGVARPATSSSPSSSSHSNPSSMDRYVRTFLSLSLFLYLPFSNAVMTHLNCVPVGDGVRVVFVAPTINCDTSAYKVWLGVLILLTVVVVAGAPIALAYQLYRYRYWVRMQGPEEALARTLKRSDSVSATYMATPSAPPSFHRFHHRFGLLYEPYSSRHRHAYLYHVWVLLRRLGVVIIDVAFFSNAPMKYVAFSLWNSLVLHVHLHMKPYRERAHDWLETATLAALSIMSLLLIPYAEQIRVGSHPLPLAIQLMLAILVLPLTIGLLVKIIYNTAQRLIAMCKKAKKAKNQTAMTVGMTKKLTDGEDVEDTEDSYGESYLPPTTVTMHVNMTMMEGLSQTPTEQNQHQFSMNETDDKIVSTTMDSSVML